MYVAHPHLSAVSRLDMSGTPRLVLAVQTSTWPRVAARYLSGFAWALAFVLGFLPPGLRTMPPSLPTMPRDI
jgi:hypothetical protein